MRKISCLLWAKALAEKPDCIRRGRHRGAKAAGIRYENNCAKAMPWAKQGLWWEFFDSGGHGYCQTDLLWKMDEFVIVAEVKYTWVPEAQEKLLGLYLPVVSKALGLEARPLVICRRLVPGLRPVYGDLRHAQSFALAAGPFRPVATFQWLGQNHISDPRIEPLKRKVIDEHARV